MKLILLLFTYFLFALQAISQETDVEIHFIQSNSIVKGQLLESKNDSVYIRLDSLNVVAFAKTELEGKDLPVSKEVKKFQRKLMRAESRKHINLFPGVYQIRNGEVAKGRAMIILSSIGIVGAISSGVVFTIEILKHPGVYSVLFATFKSITVFVSGAIFWAVGSTWSMGDQSLKIQAKIKNRYYYRSDISTKSPIIPSRSANGYL